MDEGISSGAKKEFLFEKRSGVNRKRGTYSSRERRTSQKNRVKNERTVETRMMEPASFSSPFISEAIT
jgi:hypothetical protein